MFFNILRVASNATTFFLVSLSFTLMSAIFSFSSAQSTYDKIKTSKLIIAGNSGSYPPFEMMDGNNLIGFDVDLAEELGKRMGVKIKFEVIDFKGLIASLTSKRVDVLISAVTWTPERAERISFSTPYYNAGIGALFREKNPISSPQDLTGKIVGVQLGSSGDLYVREKVGSLVKEVKTYDDIMLAVKDLENGRVEAVVNPIPVLRHNAKSSAGIRVTDVWDSRIVGINTRKEDADLLAEINKHIGAMKSDGFLDRIDKKWFGVK
ncbi:MAG: basic amino acid ABC transporter substrate-binding protein [Betaproteobacteria bacterium]|nr:basic amino acid ABC transporter substrate-binding protein [Betaproteobacteria bacterium]